MLEQKVIYEVGPTTRAAVECLSQAGHGDLVTWAELTEAMGRNAQQEGRSNVSSARRILLRQGYVFRPDGTGLGLTRLTPAQVSRVAFQRVRKAGRQARYGMKEQSTLTDAQFQALGKDRQ